MSGFDFAARRAPKSYSDTSRTINHDHRILSIAASRALSLALPTRLTRRWALACSRAATAPALLCLSDVSGRPSAACSSFASFSASLASSRFDRTRRTFCRRDILYRGGISNADIGGTPARRDARHSRFPPPRNSISAESASVTLRFPYAHSFHPVAAACASTVLPVTRRPVTARLRRLARATGCRTCCSPESNLPRRDRKFPAQRAP